MSDAPHRGQRKCGTCLFFGYCDFKLPAVLNQMLWGKQRRRLTSKEDWCHLWQPSPTGPTLQRSVLDGFLIGGPTAIEDGS